MEFEPIHFDKNICLKLSKAISHIEKNGLEAMTLNLYIDDGGHVDYCSYNIENQHMSPGSGLVTRPFTTDKNFGEFLDEILEDIATSISGVDSPYADDEGTVSLYLEFQKNENGSWISQSYSTISVMSEEEEEEDISLEEFTEQGDSAFIEVVEFLKAHDIKSLTWEFAGGGDSGSLEDLSFEYEGDHEALFKIIKDTKEFCFETEPFKGDSLHDGLESYLYERLNNIGDWVNNDGGSGRVTISIDGSYHRETSYNYYEDKELEEIRDIDLAIPIDKAGKKQWSTGELSK